MGGVSPYWGPDARLACFELLALGYALLGEFPVTVLTGWVLSNATDWRSDPGPALEASSQRSPESDIDSQRSLDQLPI